MTDEQILSLINEGERGMADESPLFLLQELTARGLSIPVHLKFHILIREASKLIYPQFNTSLLEKAIRDLRDGKPTNEIMDEMPEAGWEPEKIYLFWQALAPELEKRIARSFTTITTGTFITLAGFALHLINPSRFEYNPAGIIANCGILIGVFVMIRGITGKRKYSLALKNLHSQTI